mmetsp:Transcript_28021/g.56584  ORF Transcript_28021/g.56584 Transcript_28021/m.56584 type:complete len:101 (-) Transcript_28021:1308-1610(-)
MCGLFVLLHFYTTNLTPEVFLLDLPVTKQSDPSFDKLRYPSNKMLHNQFVLSWKLNLSLLLKTMTSNHASNQSCPHVSMRRSDETKLLFFLHYFLISSLP